MPPGDGLGLWPGRGLLPAGLLEPDKGGRAPGLPLMGGKTERPPGAILGGIGRGGITRAGLFSSLSLFNDKFENGLSRSITEKIRESKKEKEREKGGGKK